MTHAQARKVVTDAIQLVSLAYGRGDGNIHTARIVVKTRGIEHSSQGRSPVGTIHAIATAIRHVVPNQARIKLFEARNTNPSLNSESPARVHIVLVSGKAEVEGEGEDTDTTTASAKAYVNALSILLGNRM